LRDSLNYNWDDGYYEDDYYEYMRGLEVPGESYDFQFYTSRPAGSGYSNVADKTGTAYQTIALSPAGLYVASENAMGGEPFEVRLVLDEGQNWDASSKVEVSTWYNGSYYLDKTNYSDIDSSETTIVWYLVFEAPPYTTQSVEDEYHMELQKDQDLNLWFNGGWQSAWFYYVGYPVVHMATDFDDNNTNMTGKFITEGGDLVRSTDYYDWPIYGTPDNTYNNWKIGVPNEEHWYDGADTENKVLGLSWGDNVSDYYDWYRYDFVTFPEFDYPDDKELRVSFKVRYEFDYWDDYVNLQVEDDPDNWNSIGWFSGTMDWERQQENNGWYTYISEPFWSYPDNPQGIRFEFFSNDYEESVGIMIDDFKVIELQ